MMRTMAASIWWKRSCSTCSFVFLLSSSLSLQHLTTALDCKQAR